MPINIASASAGFHRKANIDCHQRTHCRHTLSIAVRALVRRRELSMQSVMKFDR
jgi:hypothetical protein